ncbi:MAG: hypothetical protein AAF629_06805 [Chloroflexota bacterium]
MIQAKNSIHPARYLPLIAETMRVNTALDGALQGDGWGIAYLDEDRVWHIEKSSNPIWHDSERFSTFPPSRHFMIHARSTGESEIKLTHNQPYGLTFSDAQTGQKRQAVFCCNLAIRGMKRRQIQREVKARIEGEIGAQKVAFLVQHFLQAGHTHESALSSVSQLLRQYAQDVQVANLGLMNENGFAAACLYTLPATHTSPYAQDHYRLQTSMSDDVQIVGSNQFGDFEWQAAYENGEVRSSLV